MTLSEGQNREALIFDVQRFSIHDGPGIRTTVFFKGCPLHCWWCHNPESWLGRPELFFSKSGCINCGRCTKICKYNAATKKGLDRNKCVICGECVKLCPTLARRIAGYKIKLNDLMNEIIKDKDFYELSGGGVTVSGGEPLLQAGFVLELFKHCKMNKISTALQTCGYSRNFELLSLLKYTDMVLLDIKHMDDGIHKKATGISNKLILENANLISNKGIPIFIRVPVMPGFNDNREDIAKIVKFASGLKSLQKINLFKFHDLGMCKWKLLGKKPPEYPAGVSDKNFKKLCSVSNLIAADDNIGLV